MESDYITAGNEFEDADPTGASIGAGRVNGHEVAGPRFATEFDLEQEEVDGVTRKPEWAKWYLAEWLLDPNVMAMSWAQRGVFAHLLCVQGREGSIPGDPESVRRMMHISPGEWKRIWTPLLADRFPLRNGGIRTNARMSEAVKAWSAMSDGGRRGGLMTESSPSLAKAPLEAPLQAPLEAHGVDQIRSEETRKEQDQAARKRALPKRPIWWDVEGGKLDGTPEAKKKIAADWVGPDKLTMAELKEEMETATYWLSDHPTKRTPRSDLKRFLYNWLKRTIESKRSGAKARSRIEQKRGEGRPQPEPVKQKWCPRCRETLPAHSEWCPDRADADWDTEGKGV